MENMNFGWDAVVIIFAIMFVEISLQVFVPVWLTNVLSRTLQPFIVRLHKHYKPTNNLTEDFVSYEYGVLIIAPIVFTVLGPILGYLNISSWNQISFLSLLMNSSFLVYYIFSLSLWKYDQSFKSFQRVSKRQVIVNAMLIFVSAFFNVILSLFFAGILIFRNRTAGKPIPVNGYDDSKVSI